MTRNLLWRTGWTVVTAGLATALVGGGASALDARQTDPLAVQTTGAPPVVPFGPGERAEYQVKLGNLPVGSGAMEVLGLETVNGALTYHTLLRVSGGIPLARVDDKFESWIDVHQLFSRRYKQDQKELTFKRRRTYEFFPERRMYRRLDNRETGSIPTDRPLDDVSFLFYARTLPLKVGDVYTVPRYFKADGNPVVLKVLRKETVQVPAGTFETVVVQPIIKTDGLFSEGGRAEVYFSDDSRRLMVQLKSRVPVVGSLNLYLESYRAGEPYTGVARPAHAPGSE